MFWNPLEDKHLVTCGNDGGAGGQQTARVAERDSAMEREGMVGRVEGCFCSGGGGKCGYLTRIAIGVELESLVKGGLISKLIFFLVDPGQTLNTLHWDRNKICQFLA